MSTYHFREVEENRVRDTAIITKYLENKITECPFYLKRKHPHPTTFSRWLRDYDLGKFDYALSSLGFSRNAETPVFTNSDAEVNSFLIIELCKVE